MNSSRSARRGTGSQNGIVGVDHAPAQLPHFVLDIEPMASFQSPPVCFGGICRMLRGSRNCRTNSRSFEFVVPTRCLRRIPSTADPAGGKVLLSTTETFALDRPIGAAFQGRRRLGFVPG